MAVRPDSNHGDHGRGKCPRISDLAITALAVIWQQKQPAEAERNLFAKGQCYRPHPAVPGTGPDGLPRRCSAKFGETDP